MAVSLTYYVLFLLHSLSVEVNFLLILMHASSLTPGHHNLHPILKVALSIWENLWSVRQFIQTVDVPRIQVMQPLCGRTRGSGGQWDDASRVCVCIKMPVITMHLFP